MRKAGTVLLEQRTQTPSPAPDLIPAENDRQHLTGNSHSDWYSKRGHFTTAYAISIGNAEETGGTSSRFPRDLKQSLATVDPNLPHGELPAV